MWKSKIKFGAALTAGLIACFLSCAGSTPAGAQNSVCPTAAPGDSTNRCASTAFVQAAVSGGGNLPLPSGKIYIGSIANIATAQALSGAADCSVSLSINGVMTFTCTKTNGVAFAPSATTDTTNASNISGGTLGTARLPPGVPTNIRLSKSAAYTVASGDAGSTLALNGNAYFPVTFDAPSGYPANTLLLVENEDALAAKLIVPQFTTSSSSATVGTGTQTFTVPSGLTFSAILRYRAYSLANHANFVSGTASYAGTTLTLTVDLVGGSGTFTDWQIAPEIFLWPGQTQFVFNQNNVWLLSHPGLRWKAPLNTTMFMDAINGHDYNDCLVSGRACKTFNWTLRTLVKDYFDLTGQTNFSAGNLTGTANLIVQLADNATSPGACTTCYAGAHLDFSAIGYEGRASIVIRGDIASPQNVVISDSVLANNIDVYSATLNIELDSLQVGQSSCSATPKTPGAGIQSNDHAIVRLERGVFVGCATVQQLSANSQGAINDDNGVTFLGGGAIMAGASDGGNMQLTNQIVTCSGSLAYSFATISSQRMGLVNLQNVTWTGCSTVTGTRFIANELSLITTNTGTPNTVIPGNANGTSTGGSNVD